MDDATFKKLTVTRSTTKNILFVDCDEYADDTQKINIADQQIRSFAQNLIDHEPEHRHLKGAAILMLCIHKDADAKKLKKGERIKAGYAAAANKHVRFLSKLFCGKQCRADWVLTISGDWLDAIDGTEDRDGRLLALIDHELLHCGAKIAGAFVPEDQVEAFVADLGKKQAGLHIETCTDIVNDDDEVLVRYYETDKKGNFQPTLRKHDVEEFEGVGARHGAWDRQIGRFVDVLKKYEKTLFSEAG